MFYVVSINKTRYGIAFRNKDLLSANKYSAYKLLPVPKEAWGFFTTKRSFDILWDLIRELGPMPEIVRKRLEKQLGKPVQPIFENATEELVTDFSIIDTKGSSILSSISELS